MASSGGHRESPTRGSSTRHRRASDTDEIVTFKDERKIIGHAMTSPKVPSPSSPYFSANKRSVHSLKAGVLARLKLGRMTKKEVLLLASALILFTWYCNWSITRTLPSISSILQHPGYHAVRNDSLTPVQGKEAMRQLFMDDSDLECLAWRQTAGCSSRNIREPEGDMPCSAVTGPESSGFCEFRSKRNGDLYSVMPLDCGHSSDFGDIRVRCDSIRDMVYRDHYKVITSLEDIKKLWKKGSVKCRAWKQTKDCNAWSFPEMDRYKECHEVVEPVAAGYCEFEDVEQGIFYHVSGRDCDPHRERFSCDSLLYTLDPSSYLTVESFVEADKLAVNPAMRCQGFYATEGPHPSSSRDPARDLPCDTLVDASLSGFCVYKNTATGEMYRLVPKNSSSFIIRCDSIALYNPEAPVPPATVISRTLIEKEGKRLWDELDCLSFMAVDSLSGGGEKRTPALDHSCDATLLPPLSGWCEYVHKVSKKRYRIDLRETHYHRPLSCKSPQDWFGKSHTFILDFKAMAKTLEAHPGLRCITYRPTTQCSPYSNVRLENRSCDARVGQFDSGFCEYEDPKTGKLYGLAPHECGWFLGLKCANLPAMVRFSRKLDKEVAQLKKSHGYPLPLWDQDYFARTAGGLKAVEEKRNKGIITCIHPGIWINAYALFRLLSSYGTQLPIEVWSDATEFGESQHHIQQLLKSAYKGPLSWRTATMPVKHGEKVSEYDKMTRGFLVKIFALLNTAFSEVLLLDADNYPVRDPEYLFDLQPYRETGAVFWPDFWHPQYSIFVNLGSSNYLWKMLNMDFQDMHEQESGQLLIDLRRSKGPLGVLQHLMAHHELLYSFIWGDKDMYRLSWMKYGQPFHMIKRRPGNAGFIREKGEGFCGLTIVQHDSKGDIIFLHRNGAKLSKPEGRKFIWQYIQRYDRPGYGQVVNQESCYQYYAEGQWEPFSNLRFAVSDIEAEILRHTREGLLALSTLQRSVYTSDQVEEFRSIGLERTKKLPDFRVDGMWEKSEIERHINAGYGDMKELRVVLCALARNVDLSLLNMITLLELTGSKFKDYAIVLLERGSSDRTRDVIQEWSKRNGRVHLVPDEELQKHNLASEPQQFKSQEDRVQRMAALRNVLLSHARTFSHDILAVFDSDMSGGWEIDGIASSFGYRASEMANRPYALHDKTRVYVPWDVMCSNGQVKSEFSRYYDAKSFKGQGVDHRNFQSLNYAVIDQLRPVLEVDTCYGGLTLYQASVIGSCTYSPYKQQSRLTEHEQFHDCLRIERAAYITLNPRQKVYHRAQRTRRR